MDATIIGDLAPYHLPVPSPSQSCSSVPVNPSSVDDNPALAASTIPFTSLTCSRKVWNIQGRVIAKTKLHEYGNQRGSGKIFGFDIVNASHDEIHISAFNELALSLYEQIHIGIVYIVSNGTVKASNPIFNHLKSHHEIFLGSSSTIQPCLDKYPLIPLHCFNFKTIQDIQTIHVNSMVDLLGLVISV